MRPFAALDESAPAGVALGVAPGLQPERRPCARLVRPLADFDVASRLPCDALDFPVPRLRSGRSPGIGVAGSGLAAGVISG